MVIAHGSGSLEAFVSTDFGLLTGFAGFFDNEICHSAAIDFESCHLLEALAACCHSCVENLLGESYESGVFGHEVGFALECEHCGEVSVVLGENAAFSCFAVLAFGGYGLTLLAKNFNSCFDVAVGFGQSFFAVHQAGACEVAQLGDICHGWCHIVEVLRVL